MKIAPYKFLFPGKMHLVLAISILTSCSNLPRQTITYIEINSNVSAICKFTDAWGTRLINTPGIVYADTKHGPAKLQCKSNGYKDFIETEIGGIKNKQPYPTNISVTMIQEIPEINVRENETNQTIEHADGITKLTNTSPGKITDSQENINDHILKMNPSHYTLSLFSMKSKKSAVEAIQKNGLKEQAMLFSYHKMGHQWHVVTYGDYATVEIAKKAVATLPGNLQTLKPWIRNFSSIHNDIGISSVPLR